MPQWVRLSEGLGSAVFGFTICIGLTMIPNELISVPGVEPATDIPSRRIVAVLLAGPRHARVQWALTVPAESFHYLASSEAKRSSGLFYLGISCLLLALGAKWRQAISRS